MTDDVEAAVQGHREPVADAAVSACGAEKRFGRLRAVQDATFTVQRGEVFGFLGPNGAGKTTMLRLLLGLLARDGGRLRVLGCDPQVEGGALRRRVGYVTQLHSLYTDLTVEENLAFFAAAYGLQKAEVGRRIAEEVARFRLEGVSRELVGRQPTGVRRRVALAAALLHRPELLILDEPTSGMDPTVRREFWTFLGGLAGGSTTVIVTTHHLEEVESCDRLGLMLDGRVRFEGTPSALRQQFGAPVLVVQATPWAEAFLALKASYGGALFGQCIHVDGGRAGEAEIRATLEGAGCCVGQIDHRAPAIEDAFLRAAEHFSRSGG
ncbi:MAG: ABC transporter ATP-binding protein [Gaiellales bacterium]|nr:ABC transporter ATP-binding protein [Gaiellales bacterium]